MNRQVLSTPPAMLLIAMWASLIFPLPLPEGYSEEKTQEKIDKSSDWG